MNASAIDVPDLTTVLRAYAAMERRRATGGLWALAGFDFQLRVALADFAVMLADQGASLERAGGVFVETLSDYVRREKDRIVCVQVKRTLTRATLRHAAEELIAIDRFLSQGRIGWADEVRFEIVASSIAPVGLDWSILFDDADYGGRLRALSAEARLLPPRRVDDPWWRLVSAVFADLNDPFAFARFALDCLLSRTNDPEDAARARNEIAERYKKDCRPDSTASLGHVPHTHDFDPVDAPSDHLLVGRAPTLSLLRDAQYMPRHGRLALAQAELERLSGERSQPAAAQQVELFWIHGRSGVGKSVLLLQLLEALVRMRRRAVWLGAGVEQLEPLLRACGNRAKELCPEFIFVDDLYDPDSRDRLDLVRLGRFIEEQGPTTWPTLVTCGPYEFVEAFRHASRQRGFAVREWVLSPIDASEADALASWFEQRTGRRVRRGTAFAQARASNGLLLSVAFEAEHGDLRQFAARFCNRLQAADAEFQSAEPGLVHQLKISLALGRLYLGTPYAWLTRRARERLQALNRDGDYTVFDLGLDAPRRYVRLTHPHLSDAIYRALRWPATPLGYAHDLGSAFARALAEADGRMVARLLRLFAEDDWMPVIKSRLADVDYSALVASCLEAWTEHPLDVADDGDLAGDVATSWAVLALKQPEIAAAFNGTPLAGAVATLDGATERWPEFCRRLWRRYPHDSALRNWATGSLGEPERMAHPQWSFVWEAVFVGSPHDGQVDELAALACRWLAVNETARDWHFVWRHLIPSTDRMAVSWEAQAVELGLQRLDVARDRAEWGFVFEDLLRIPKALPPEADAQVLVKLGWQWLAEPDRDGWSHVWQAVLQRAVLLPVGATEATVVERGWHWLDGGKDRDDWSYLWQALLERPALLPTGVTEADVVERGWRWLDSHEDRHRWSFVWEAMFERPALLPTGVTEAAVVERGWRWLDGRQDRDGWSFVWQAVLERPTLLPTAVTEDAIVEHGWRWLDNHQDRDGWSFVLRAVLERPALLPTGVTEAAVVEYGWRWLDGRQDRDGWSFVWQVVLERPAFLPKGLTEAAVVERGWRWLDGRQDRDDWSFVWQSVLERPALWPTGESSVTLIDLGVRWLREREQDSDWPVVWSILSRHWLELDSTHRDILSAAAFSWLAEPKHERSGPRGHLIENLLDLGFGHAAVVAGAEWLDTQSRHPAWPVVAAKAIAVSPSTPEAERWILKLIATIEAEPFRQESYEKIEAQLGPAFDKRNPGSLLERLSTVLSTRPRDLEARFERLDAWLRSEEPITARIIERRGWSAMVVIEGVRARLDHPIGTALLDPVRVVVTTIDRVRRRITVRLSEPPHGTDVDARVGAIEYGHVVGTNRFGLFVEFRGIVGSVDRSRLPNGSDPRRHFQLGDPIQIRVQAVDSKGIHLVPSTPNTRIFSRNELVSEHDHSH